MFRFRFGGFRGLFNNLFDRFSLLNFFNRLSCNLFYRLFGNLFYRLHLDNFSDRLFNNFLCGVFCNFSGRLFGNIFRRLLFGKLSDGCDCLTFAPGPGFFYQYNYKYNHQGDHNDDDRDYCKKNPLIFCNQIWQSDKPIFYRCKEV